MWNKIYTSVKYSLITVNFLFLISGIIVLSVGSSVQSAYNGYHEFLSERFFSLPAFCIATGVIIFIIAFFGFYGAYSENYYLIMAISGIIVLSVGSSVQSAYNGYHEFLSERFFSLPAFCIATGVIIFIIAFFGFYGAYSENYYLIMAFAGAMILMFIFQLSACIAGYVLKNQTTALVQTQLQNTMDLYGPTKNYEVTELWDEVQIDFVCCGVLSSSDWLQHLDTQETQGLPVSCCILEFGTISTFTCNVTTAYRTGCAAAFGSWTQSNVGAIGAAGVFLVLIQALAVGGALWMAKISRAVKCVPVMTYENIE